MIHTELASLSMKVTAPLYSLGSEMRPSCKVTDVSAKLQNGRAQKDTHHVAVLPDLLQIWVVREIVLDHLEPMSDFPRPGGYVSTDRRDDIPWAQNIDADGLVAIGRLDDLGPLVMAPDQRYSPCGSRQDGELTSMARLRPS